MIPTHGAFCGVEFTKQDGPSGVESRYDRSVKVRHMLRQGFGAAHGAHARGKVQVLDRHWHPMERAAVSPGTDVLLRRLGSLYGMICHDCGIALQRPIELRNALEQRLRHLHRRELSRL